MSLEEKLAEIRLGSKERIPADKRAEMHRATAELKASGIQDRALSVGASIEPFLLPNTESKVVGSTDLLQNGPLVITFYRGVW